MIIDGKKLRDEIKNSLREEILKLDKKLRLAVIKIGNDAATKRFLEQKRKFADEIGISTRIYDFSKNISTTELRKEISKIVHIKENTGVIIQLPLPGHIKTDYILDALPPKKDPDMLSGKSMGLFVSGRSKILPPVVGAVRLIFEKNSIEFRNKNILVVGAGRLVGKPVAIWLINQGATITVLNKHTGEVNYFTKNADIIVSGAGRSNLITPEMVKDKVITIDCGTSEIGGRLVGDIDPAVANKASIFTPVPGGVGPITVAMLFLNLIEIGKKS